MVNSLRVLGIFPHPDDEAYSCGGTFARLAHEGAEVHILCATAGEVGQDLRGQALPGTNLANSRGAELAAACAVLGALPPRFLGLQDGGVGDVNFPAVAGQIIAEIRAARPHLVLALGPDGVYGHPDHVALYRLILAAFSSAGGGERFSEDAFGPYWQPTRLCLAAFPRGMFRPMYNHMLHSEYVTAFRQLDPDSLGVEPAQVAVSVDIRPFADRKLRAIGCHRSQLSNDDPDTLFPDHLVRRTLTTELFTIGAGPAPERRLRHVAEGLEV